MPEILSRRHSLQTTFTWLQEVSNIIGLVELWAVAQRSLARCFKSGGARMLCRMVRQRRWRFTRDWRFRALMPGRVLSSMFLLLMRFSQQLSLLASITRHSCIRKSGGCSMKSGSEKQLVLVWQSPRQTQTVMKKSTPGAMF